MTWQSRARRRRILNESLWLVPAASMLAALLLAPLVRWVDEQTRWTLLGFGPDSARAVVGALSASLLTFIVFALSTLLLLAQMARLREGAADARRHRRTLERCGRAGAAQTRVAPAVQSGSGQVQTAAAASSGRP